MRGAKYLDYFHNMVHSSIPPPAQIYVFTSDTKSVHLYFLFTRLKSTSQSDHPTRNHQHQLMDTNSINKTQSHNMTSNHQGDITVDSGLDWFNSIIPSRSLDVTSPIITSTQEVFHRKPNSSWSEMSLISKQSNCQTDKEVLRNTGSSLVTDVVSNPDGTVTPASGDDRKSERNQNVKGMDSLTPEGVKQSGRQENRKHPESSDCVTQKASKNLRGKRLRELELTHQKCDKGEGGVHCRRVVLRDSTCQFVTSDTTSDSHSKTTLSSGKTCPSNNQVQDNLSPVKESRSEAENRRKCTGTTNISTMKRKKMEAEVETGKDLHARLSGFIFKPKKMGPLVHNQSLNSSSDMSGEFQAEPNPGNNRDLQTNKHNKESSVSHRKEVGCNESSSTLKDTDKDRGKKNQKQCQNLLGGGGVRKQVSCVSEVVESESEANFCFTTEELQRNVFSCGKDKLPEGKTFRIHGNDNTENRSHQQRTRFNTGMDSNVVSCISSPPSKPGLSKSAVASSTLDKLSAFSFTSTTEPKTTDRTKADIYSTTGMEISPFKRRSTECLRVNSQDKNTLNSSECSPLRKKITTAATLSKVQDILPPPATEVTPGQEHEPETESSTKTKYKCNTKETEPTHAANHNSVQMVTDNMNKRKCFELGPRPNNVGGSGGLFSKLSLFGSVELNDDDVLDTDWDQEVSKKAKV